MTSGRVCKSFHFKKSNLIKTACKDINDMAIVGSSLGQVVVELELVSNWHITAQLNYLECFLVVFDVITVDIVVRSYRFPQFRPNYHTRSLGCRSASEQHDTAA